MKLAIVAEQVLHLLEIMDGRQGYAALRVWFGLGWPGSWAFGSGLMVRTRALQVQAFWAFRAVQGLSDQPMQWSK